MSTVSEVFEYKCPCCDAGLKYSGAEQKLTCEYCDNTFDLETVQQYNEAISEAKPEGFEWDDHEDVEWSGDEQSQMRTFQCPTCAGELIADNNTAATFCPYCDNPAVIPGRVSGGLRPDAVIPFKTTKDDAKNALLRLSKGKHLLPRDFTSQNRLEKITGIYVPFWLYGCSGSMDGQYKATRVSRWSDSRYNYTRTDYFMLTRSATAKFSAIPMDASSKMDDTVMESIEPFRKEDAVDFNMAYLSGFLADKYDVEARSGEARIRVRVGNTFDEKLAATMSGYATVVPTTKNLRVDHNQAKYVLLPVWVLNSVYHGKTYTFAMNGQTGKITGELPIDKGRMWAWFAGVSASVSVLAGLIGLLLF